MPIALELRHTNNKITTQNTKNIYLYLEGKYFFLLRFIYGLEPILQKQNYKNEIRLDASLP